MCPDPVNKAKSIVDLRMGHIKAFLQGRLETAESLHVTHCVSGLLIPVLRASCSPQAYWCGVGRRTSTYSHRKRWCRTLTKWSVEIVYSTQAVLHKKIISWKISTSYLIMSFGKSRCPANEIVVGFNFDKLWIDRANNTEQSFHTLTKT